MRTRREIRQEIRELDDLRQRFSQEGLEELLTAFAYAMGWAIGMPGARRPSDVAAESIAQALRQLPEES